MTSHSDNQFELDLVFSDSLFSQPETKDQNLASDVEEEVSWTDEEIRQMHRILLDITLSTIASTASKTNEVKESVEWVMAEPGKSKSGFSFSLCCNVAGVDEDVIRDEAVRQAAALHGVKLAL